jgi:diguanylate cyclase (GGDEF)-like protein/PAS domain S-box-containing protein
MVQGIILADANRKITYVNPASEKLTGYSLAELLGKSCSLLQGPDTDQEQIQRLRIALENHQAFNGELLNYRKDGAVFWNELTITPIFNSQGQLTQYLGMQRDVTERKHFESQLILSEQSFRDLANSAPSMIWLAGVDKKLFWFNNAWLKFTGHSMTQEISNGWQGNMHPEDHYRCLDIYHTHFDQRLPFRIEYRMRANSGEYRWIDCHGVPRFNANGVFKGYISYGTDITEAKHAKVANDFFNSSHELIYSTDLNGFILEVNDRFLQVTGYTREELLGRHIRLIKSGLHDASFYAEMWKAVLEQGFWCGEVTNRSKDGTLYSAVSTITAVRDEMQKPVRYLAIASDISAVIEKRRQIEQLAYYDSLTGLPNRLLLKDRLAQGIARVKRNGGCLAIVFIDLDGFKSINDNYGHDVGDEFLIAISQQMKLAVREVDTLVRIGGDEFIVLLADLDNEQDADKPINHLLQACQTPIHLNNLVLKVSASIGLSFYQQTSDKQEIDIDGLIRQADQAMYVAKQSGKNGIHRFDGQTDTLSNTRTEILKDIQVGLEEGQFVLYYQPKVNMRSGDLVGVEALIRWQHPTRGLLTPSAFLPLVENHPIAVEIGYWVLRTALAQIEAWRDQGLSIPVSVNIDARQLNQHDFLSKLKQAIAAYPKFQPGSLEFEILETTALQDRQYANQVIEACKQIGVEFALDDFGTGYSSLTYLRQLPINTIKIDRSFVNDMDINPEDLAIVESVISLVNNIGRKVIAEGVETIQQGEMLLNMGCEFGQGFVIAKPMPARELIAWKAHWKPVEAWVNSRKIQVLAITDELE